MRRRRSIEAEVDTGSKDFDEVTTIAPACDAAHTDIIINGIIEQQQTGSSSASSIISDQRQQACPEEKGRRTP